MGDQPYHLTSVGGGDSQGRGDWRKIMDGGQEHFTEWNLGERVELGGICSHGVRGSVECGGGRDLQVVKNKYLLKNMVFMNDMTGEKKGLGERVCVRLCVGGLICSFCC